MKKCLYVVRDTLAEDVVGGVLMFPSDGPAVRFFGDVLAEPKSSVAAHPNDHVLTYIGSIDAESGVIDLEGSPRDVVSAAAIVASRQMERAD